MGFDIEKYNKYLKSEYEKTKDAKVLEKYIMSELQDPIEDFENAVKLICENQDNLTDNKLLFIGAYLAAYWPAFETNQLLEMLCSKYETLTENEIALTAYLKAFQMESDGYQCAPEYRELLLRSLNYDGKFVNNRLRLAEISRGSERKKWCADVVDNFVEVASQKDLEKYPDEKFLDPQYYIDEFILGIRTSYVVYKGIMDKLNKMNNGL